LPSILSIFFAVHSLDLHFFTIIFLLLWWHVNSLRSWSRIFFKCFFSQSNISRISIIVFIVLISVYSWYHFVWLFLGVKSLLLFRTNQTTVQVQRYRNSFLTRALEMPNSLSSSSGCHKIYSSDIWWFFCCRIFGHRAMLGEVSVRKFGVSHNTNLSHFNEIRIRDQFLTKQN
jgi:hypothetical protein